MRLSLVCAALFLLAPLAGRAQEVPAAIGPEAVRQAKQATVYLKVTTAGGLVGEGSGFLAIEPGIIITNAHVVGMLSASSKPPTRIDVVVRSGEADELPLTGKLLGVDRVNDLAVLKVEGKLPAPLQLGLKDDMFETQKVYIFGFPFGARLGKDITVSESSISSLRKDASGALDRIQVNGGMHPGNSGGPVVNAAGRVIGVSVAGIRATAINFAIPAKSVRALLEGGIQEVKAGELFRDKDQVHVPLHYRTLDPFGRIQEIRVETWAGAPAASRPFSTSKELPQKGDGPRQSQVLKPVDAVAAGDVLVPTAPAGQVAWVQPVLVFAKGDAVWGAPMAVDPALAVDRVPAELVIKLADQKERTVHLKTSQVFTLIQGKLRLVSADAAELDILESFAPDPKGAHIRMGFGIPRLTFEEDGRKTTVAPQVMALLRQIPPAFIVDDTNKLRERTSTSLSPKVALLLREQVNDFMTQITNGYEASTFILPNRKLEPRDVWKVEVPMLMKMAGKAEVLDLVLSCTYEGIRGKGDAAEALVSFSGMVQGRGAMKDKTGGEVAGKFTFNPRLSFISSVRMTMFSDLGAGASDVQAQFAFNIDLTRIEGNPRKLELPKLAKAPPPAKGEVLLTRNGVLSPKNPLDPVLGEKGSRMQVIPIDLELGKKYSILLDSSAFDCYLRLVEPAGKIVAEDDDGGGGTNSRIDHVAAKTGKYKIVVTSFDGKAGPFQLKVLVDGGKEVAKIDPKTKLDVPVKGFDKPAKSAAPTSYLKIVSSAGDFIGQGKTYEYTGDQLALKAIPRGVSVRVDGWNLNIGAPNGQVLAPGEYRDAKRFAFSGDSPGLDFFGKGRGSSKLAGEFVVWELEVADGRITRLAIDFVQRSEERGPPLLGKLRFNSSLE